MKNIVMKPLTKSNITEIIDEIVNEGEKRLMLESGSNKFKECPVCHQIVPQKADYCPYCFEPLTDNVDIKKLTNHLLESVSKLSKIASSRDLYIPNLIENINNAKKLIRSGKFKDAHRILQDSYIHLVERVSNSMLEESRRYRILLELNPKNRVLFKKLESLIDEWKFEEAVNQLEKIRDVYTNFARDLQIFLEELEHTEIVATMAEDLGLDISQTLEVIDRAKDEGDKRNYKRALEILEDAFEPLREDIEKRMNDILERINQNKDRLLSEDDVTSKKIIRLLQELKFYWSKRNLASVIERLDEILKEVNI